MAKKGKSGSKGMKVGSSISSRGSTGKDGGCGSLPGHASQPKGKPIIGGAGRKRGK